MINLNENPHEVRALRDGEIVLVDDHRFQFQVVEGDGWEVQHVFLTAIDPAAIVGEEAFNAPEGEYEHYKWVHLRMSNHALGGAAMPRAEMINILEKKEYKLS